MIEEQRGMTTEAAARSAPRGVGGAGPAQTGVLAVVSIAVGLALAWLVGAGIDLGSEAVLFLVAAPFAAALTLLAVTRFEWFVWTALLVRPSLDVLSGGAGLGAGAMLSAMFLVIATIWLLAQRRAGEWRPLGPATRAMLAFAVAVALSVVTSELRIVSARAALEILAGISMFLVLEQLLPGRLDRLRRLVVAVMASAVVPVAVALQQWMTGGGNVRGDLSRIYGTFVHPNPFATYLGMLMVLGVCVALTVDGRRRILAGGFVALLGLVVVMTFSRGGWIALIVAAGYLGVRRSKWVLGALVGVLVAIALLVPSVGDRLGDLGEDERWLPEGVPRNSLEWRFQYWGDLIPMANDSPVTGIGPQVILNSRPERLEPHNVFVQVYVETGFLGFVAFLAVLATVATTLVRRSREAATPLERTFVLGATAAALAILVQLLSENLLNATMTWWYLAACATWGFRLQGAQVVDGSIGSSERGTGHQPFDSGPRYPVPHGAASSS